MGKKQKTNEITVTEEKRGSYYVRMEILVVVALCTLVVGFFASEIINLSKPKKHSPVRTSAPHVHTSPKQGPAMEQASSILVLEAEVSSNPGNVMAWTELGNLYFNGNQFQKAIKSYKKSLELNPNNADVWTDLGVMYRRSGQPRQAIESFNKAAAIDPSHETSRLNKGVVLMHDMNDLEGAIRAWEELLRMNPSAKLGSGQPVKELLDNLKGERKQQKSP